jgi:serine protease
MHGILNAGATANINLNVDIVGDLPTGCNSDFLISVTSTNINDQRNTAAFGRNSIELGSPGSGHVVLNRSNDYSGGGNGTSFATPLVAGSIALLYAAPCSDFAESAISDPAGTALKVREHILKGTDPIPSMRNITKTGGRLNVYNSMVAFLRACADCPSPSAPTFVYDELNALQIEWETDSLNIYSAYQLLYRIPGTTAWNTVDNVQSPFRLTGLDGCQEYEIALIGICDQETSFESLSTIMKTDGCCEAPREIDTLFVQPNAARVKWRPVLPADYYIMEVFNLTQGTMQTRIELNTEILLRGLRFCNEYSFRIAAVCNFDTDTTAFSEPFRFTTKGCGACTETAYCKPGDGFTNPIFISKVLFNQIEQESQASEEGFEDFRGQVALAELEESYPITIELDTIPHGPVNLRVWIDYNHDGVFNTANETAVNVNNFEGTILTRNITIPKDARQGTTRMRIAAWDADLNDTLPTPCAAEGFFGEFEDYCITIAMRTCPPAIDLDTINVDFTIAELGWTEIDAAISFVYRFKRSDEEIFSEAETTSDNMYLLTDLQPCTEYDFELLTICQFDTSALQILTFTTACPTHTEEISIDGITINTFPNPFSDKIITSIQLDQLTDVKVRMVDISGKTIYFENPGKLSPGNHSIIMDKFDRFPPGFYLLEFLTDKGNIIKKLVKQ